MIPEKEFSCGLAQRDKDQFARGLVRRAWMCLSSLRVQRHLLVGAAQQTFRGRRRESMGRDRPSGRWPLRARPVHDSKSQ